MQAAKLGLRACVRVLLQRGACVNTASDGDGHTPLHYAAYYNREHVAEVLLRAGADTAALNKCVLARVGRRRERYGLLLYAVSCRWLIRHACGHCKPGTAKHQGPSLAHVATAALPTPLTRSYS